MGESSLGDAGAAFVISTRWVQSTVDERERPRRPAMPPNEECPNCHGVIADWHVEWYKTEGPPLYKMTLLTPEENQPLPLSCRPGPLRLALCRPRVADGFGGQDQAAPDCGGVAPECVEGRVLVVPGFQA